MLAGLVLAGLMAGSLGWAMPGLERFLEVFNRLGAPLGLTAHVAETSAGVGLSARPDPRRLSEAQLDYPEPDPTSGVFPEYDEMGRVTRVRYTSGGTPQIEEYEYDEVGRVTRFRIVRP